MENEQEQGVNVWGIDNREGQTPLSYHFFTGSSTQMVAVSSNENAVFFGKTKTSVLNDFLVGGQSMLPSQLLITAVNNRTRERNFYRLCEQLAIGEISEGEYDQEITNHEDEYVIKCDKTPSLLELSEAIQLLPFIKDVRDEDDFSVLFSFDTSHIRRLLKK